MSLKIRRENTTLSNAIQSMNCFIKGQPRTALEHCPWNHLFATGMFLTSQTDSQRNPGTARCYNKAPEIPHLHLWEVIFIISGHQDIHSSKSYYFHIATLKIIVLRCQLNSYDLLDIFSC